MITYDEAIITEWSIEKMSHIALLILDTIPTVKRREGTSGGRFD